MKINFLTTFTMIFLIGVSFVTLWSFKAFNLKTHYPYYDMNTHEYSFSKIRPKSWSELKDISKNLQHAIIVSEDWAFYDHGGVDFFQLKLVLSEFMETGELSRGASTLTQQLVKNTLLNSDRSIFRKLLEYYYVALVESILTKDEILERYLNIVELGPSIYGVKAGSNYYFKRSPKSLSLRQASFLAFLLPSPINYGVSFVDKKLTPFAQKQVDSILIKMRQAKYITEEQRIYAKELKFSWEEVEFDSGDLFFNFYGD